MTQINNFKHHERRTSVFISFQASLRLSPTEVHMWERRLSRDMGQPRTPVLANERGQRKWINRCDSQGSQVARIQWNNEMSIVEGSRTQTKKLHSLRTVHYTKTSKRRLLKKTPFLRVYPVPTCKITQKKSISIPITMLNHIKSFLGRQAPPQPSRSTPPCTHPYCAHRTHCLKSVGEDSISQASLISFSSETQTLNTIISEHFSSHEVDID